MTTTEVDNWPADVHGVQGPDLMQRFLEHAERFKTQIVFDHINKVDLEQAPLHAHRRQRHLHLRLADHRHRAPRPSTSGLDSEQKFMGRGVSGLRDLRRLLLPRAGSLRDRRRQHGRRRSALPGQHREQGDAGASPRQVPRRAHPDRQAQREGRRRQDRAEAAQRTRPGAGRRLGRDGHPAQEHARPAPPSRSTSRAASSPSGTTPTPTSSRASWR